MLYNNKAKVKHLIPTLAYSCYVIQSHFVAFIEQMIFFKLHIFLMKENVIQAYENLICSRVKDVEEIKYTSISKMKISIMLRYLCKISL